uniref:Uncharacterized protein n=1 Tax=Opuntia streptacantha TaxID=393608 RepID=A0A7C8ZM07_OPUST
MGPYPPGSRRLLLGLYPDMERDPRYEPNLARQALDRGVYLAIDPCVLTLRAQSAPSRRSDDNRLRLGPDRSALEQYLHTLPHKSVEELSNKGCSRACESENKDAPRYRPLLRL